MIRILDDQELTTLTEARLQALLKAARARWDAAGHCKLCGGEITWMRPCCKASTVSHEQKMRVGEMKDYVWRIKHRLHVVQGTKS